MFRVSRAILTTQTFSRPFVRSMGKMDQFKWKPHKKRPNKKPKLSVILKDHMEGLGNKGELVDVERGFARNFLVPKGRAAYATKENIKKYLAADRDATKSDSEAQVSSKFMKFLQRTRLTVERKQNAPFEISEHQLALEYKRQHQLYVPVDCIKLPGPITTFGKHTINLAVREYVSVRMKILVEPWSAQNPAGEVEADKGT